MRVVHKFKVSNFGPTLLPRLGRILKVGVYNGDILVWFEKPTHCDDLLPANIYVIGTGWEESIHDHFHYIDTVFDGIYIWHVYTDNKEILKENK